MTRVVKRTTFERTTDISVKILDDTCFHRSTAYTCIVLMNAMRFAFMKRPLKHPQTRARLLLEERSLYEDWTCSSKACRYRPLFGRVSVMFTLCASFAQFSSR